MRLAGRPCCARRTASSTGRCPSLCAFRRPIFAARGGLLVELVDFAAAANSVKGHTNVTVKAEIMIGVFIYTVDITPDARRLAVGTVDNCVCVRAGERARHARAAASARRARARPVLRRARR